MASPFHRPPPFQFPRGPPSPPDTNPDSIFPGMPVPMLSTQPLSGQDDVGLSNPSPDIPGSRMRKSSSIPYHPTGLRDSKDRASSSQLRSGKPLIIVIPPSNLLQERGQAQIVTNGPYNRLSQGIVMPLFPSMFGQLTAIAREFNFPSTSGLCLYFHYTEDGFTLTPRISDDSWQSLWGHLSDPPLPNERRPLISGKIEFDIDHRLARWYGPWVSTIHREVSDASQHYPYTAPSHGHFRGESRTTVADVRFFDDDTGENSAIQQHSAPITRHAPRKLSLVERFESPSARPDIKPTPRALGTPPEYFPSSSQVLSPIVQEDEPKSARQDLNSRVKSWRASAQLSPTPLAATGQTSLEPPNLPNSMVLDPAHEVEIEELNMEDFTWSISSAGPQSPGEISPISWVRVPSVHLDSRLEGSVCTTPSIQTSCGPPDYGLLSLSSVESLRVSSPDIAHRFYEDRPETPLTATTWGAPLSYPPSPMSILRVASPDIAQRSYENAPDTPMTATSWGAPLSYPPSPMCLSPVPSLDLGERSVFDDVQKQFNHGLILPSQAEFSSLSLSIQPWSWSHVWPYTEHSQTTYNSASPAGSKDATVQLNAEISTRPCSHVWPHTEHGQAAAMPTSFAHHSNSNIVKDSLVWPHVWPYNSSHSVSQGEGASSMASSMSQHWTFGYPYFNIYRPQYPYFDIYPSIIKANPTEQEGINLEMSGYPHNLRAIYPVVSGVQQVRHHAYPHNLSTIYPPVTRTEENVAQEPNDKGYPHNLSQIYVAIVPRVVSRSQENEGRPYKLDNIDIEVYPHNLDHIYSTVNWRSNINKGTVSYPFFNLYPPILAPFFSYLSLYMYGPKSQYPEFEIYPELPIHSSIRRLLTLSETYAVGRSSHSVYPNFDLYPPVYPFFDLYPSIMTVEKSGPIPLGNQKLSLNTMLARYYPMFNLYPAIYPHFDIYPALVDTGRNIHTKNISTNSLATVYPSFNLYPNIYPFLEIYTAAYGSVTTASLTERGIPWEDELQMLNHSSPSIYPYFDLYPGIYPYLDIYPAPYGIGMKASASRMNLVGYVQQVACSRQAAYPYFNIYPSVYPHFDLYPAPYFETHQTQTISTVSKKLRPVAIQAIAQYPIFNLYPAIYPHFDLYLSLHPEISTVQQKKNSKASSRLTHAELHAMVMMEKVGSTGSFSHMDSMGRLGESKIHISRPGSFDSQETETVSQLDLPGRLVSTRKIHASSSTPSPEIPRISMAFKSGPSSLLQGLNPDPKLLPARSSQSPRPSQGLRPLARSGSLQEPNVPLPPRPTSLALNRSRIPPPIPPKPSPRKRDSLVLQRIKAYDSTVELSEGSTKDTLSKFPMPPKIPLPLPLDRTS